MRGRGGEGENRWSIDKTERKVQDQEQELIRGGEEEFIWTLFKRDVIRRWRARDTLFQTDGSVAIALLIIIAPPAYHSKWRPLATY